MSHETYCVGKSQEFWTRLEKSLRSLAILMKTSLEVVAVRSMLDCLRLLWHMRAISHQLIPYR